MSKQVILLTGASGQLGKTIQALWNDCALASDYELKPVDRQQLDVTKLSELMQGFAQQKPAVVINCSAYTAVDQAESDAEAAYLVNEQGPENLAQCCAKMGSRLIHISTDFVFSGSFNQPISPETATKPAGIYGASKRAGELAVLEQLPGQSLIFRTSWLYSPFNTNFVKTMLRLMAERDSLGVVADQRGAPTSTYSLAKVIFKAIEKPALSGIYHWSDAADLSWYDFANAIQESGLAAGILAQSIPIKPISTSDYPTPATRPAYSVLDCTKSEIDLQLNQFDWRQQLDYVIQRLKESDERQKLGE